MTVTDELAIFRPLDLVFSPFPKIARWNRETVITEKIDGTNAGVVIVPAPLMCNPNEVVNGGKVVNVATIQDEFYGVWVGAQSRKRLISPEDDNFGFATWVRENADTLAHGLGEGVHFGEWWGLGVQRGYGLSEKRFSLFNTSRWEGDAGADYVCLQCRCCHVVPTLAETRRPRTSYVDAVLDGLKRTGSHAAPGFMNPEGVVIYHTAANTCFKATLERDGESKGDGRAR